MSLVPMKKISLVLYNKDRDKILESLQKIGAIHFESYIPTELEKDFNLKNITKNSYSLETLINETSSTIKLLERRMPQKKSGFVETISTKKQEMNINMMQLLYFDYNLGKIINEIKELHANFENYSNKLIKLKEELAFLVNWKGKGIDLDILNGINPIYSGIVGSVPREDVPAILKDKNGNTYQDETLPLSLAIREILNNYISVYTEVYEIKKTETEKFFYIIYLKSEEDNITKFLKGNAFFEINISKRSGTIENAISEVANEIDITRSKVIEFDKKLNESLSYLDTLKIVHDCLLIEKNKLEGENKGCETEYFSFYKGFFPENKEKNILDTLSKITTVDYKIEIPEEKDNVPILLKQNPIAAPFEVVTKLYGLPQYGKSFDPTPHISPFYFVFFGFCFADFFYGIIMMALFGYLTLKSRHNKEMNSFFLFLTTLGLSTSIFGIIFSAYFADMFTEYIKIPIIVNFIHKTSFIDIFKQPMVMLYYSLLVGAIQIIYGVLLRMFTEFKHGIFHALFKNISWILFLFGAFSMALFIGFPELIKGIPQDYAKVIKVSQTIGNILVYIFISGAILIIIFVIFEKKNLITGLLEGIEKIYSSTSFLGDFLSYSRLLALGIGTTVLGAVINKLGFMLIESHINNIRSVEDGFIFSVELLFGIIILIVGHLFGLVLGAFSAFIHSARLQFVEFFSKFYKSGGKEYNPFKKEGTYFDIKI